MDLPAFDELSTLAVRDPAGFEALRSQLIEDCIRQSSPCNQRRLRGVQFVIDARRRVAGSPMKALLDIHAMMYDSFHDLRRVLTGERSAADLTLGERGRVLPFQRPSP